MLKIDIQVVQKFYIQFDNLVCNESNLDIYCALVDQVITFFKQYEGWELDCELFEYWKKDFCYHIKEGQCSLKASNIVEHLIEAYESFENGNYFRLKEIYNDFCNLPISENTIEKANYLIEQYIGTHPRPSHLIPLMAKRLLIYNPYAPKTSIGQELIIGKMKSEIADMEIWIGKII